MGERFSAEDLEMIDAGLEMLMEHFIKGASVCPDPVTWADELQSVEACIAKMASLRARVQHMTPIRDA